MRPVCAAPEFYTITFCLSSGYYDERCRKLANTLFDKRSSFLFGSFLFSDDHYFGCSANQKEETAGTALLSERKNP